MKKAMVHEEVMSSVKEVKSSWSQMSITEGQSGGQSGDQRSDAPHFLEQPRSQNVNEGQHVKFTCEIAGEPYPEVEWLKDNMIVSSFLQRVICFVAVV